MKKTILILTTILLTFTSISQAPSWIWAKTSGGNNYDEGRAIAKDASGNIYVTGKFLSQSITFGSTVLTNNGNYDMFIVKYDPSGNVIWAKNFGGTGDESSTCINIDLNGNIYIGGWFYSPSVVFGSTTINISASNNSTDLFLAKLDPSGNVIWAKCAGGTVGEDITGITTDASGSVYVTGGFDSPSLSFGTFTLTSGGPGHQVFFIVKYDSTGNAVWGRTAGGISTDVGSGIATDASGNILVTGYFHSSTITFGTTTLTCQGFYNSFTVKYDNSGNVIWAKKSGGTGDDKAFKVCTDANSNVYVVGAFTSATGVFGNTTLTNASSAGNTGDLFIIKYDSSGNAIWAKSAGNTSNDFGINLNVDPNGNPYVIGWFSSTTIDFGTTTLTKSGPDDIFIAKYDTSGNALWAKNAGCDDYMDGNDILINAQGEVYVTGAFYCDTLDLGSISLANASANTRSDILTAKLTSTLGLDEINSDKQVTIYPNPFTMQTTIVFKEEQQNVTLKITGISGKEVRTVDFTGKEFVLEKGSMQPGIYFVEIGNNVSKKIILE